MRFRNSLKNILASLGGQIFMLIINFISRNVFIQILGVRYLGLSGLFTNILSVLSLAELGVGNAIVFSLYKPLNEKNENKIIALMRFYKKCYTIIGTLILVSGLFLLPFIKFLAKDYDGIDNVHLIFSLFVINSGVSYFFSYKQSLLIADQKQYKAHINHYTFSFLMNVAQIIILLLSKNYIYFLICQSIFILFENFSISKIASKDFPFLKYKNNVNIEQKDLIEIKKNTQAMIFHKFGGIFVYGTDNIIISIFLGLTWSGLYANYKLIISSLSIIVKQIFLSLTASVGDLGAENNRSRIKEVYDIVLFINHMIYGFCAICFYFLIKKFIVMWIGTDFVMSDIVAFVFSIEFYVSGTRAPNTTFKEALGYFWNDRYKCIFESAFNLIFSIFLVNYLGISGVLLGTILSNVLTSYWVEAFVLYKNQFNESLLKYFKTIAKYYLSNSLVFIIVFICHNNFFLKTSILTFLLEGFFILLVFVFINSCFYFKTNEYQFFYLKIINIFRRIKS